ncbi:MAG: AsmA family protein, partial [Gammaproteobacteria bacterium]|nr:AsmA family protein [Gammaproteobacteria bacterium]
GLSNWDDLAAGGSGGGGSNIGAVALGGVDIKDAALSFRDASAEEPVDITVSAINVSTGALTLGAPIDVQASLTAKASAPALDADVAVTGTVAYDLGDARYTLAPLDLNTTLRSKQLPGGSADIKATATVDLNLDEQTADINGLKLTGLDSELNGNIAMSKLDAAIPAVNGSVNATGSDLALLFKVFELAGASELAGIKDKSFALSTSFVSDVAAGTAGVNGLNLTGLDSKITGDISVSNLDAEFPAVNGSIDATGANLPLLLKVFDLPAADVLASARDKSFAITTRFVSDAAAGTASMPSLDARLLGTSVNGQLEGRQLSEEKPAVKGKLSASGPDLPALLALVAQFSEDKDKTLMTAAKDLSRYKDRAFTLATNFDVDMKSGRIDLPQLTLKGMGIDLDGSLNAANINSPKGPVSGKLSLKGSPALPLLTLAGNKDMGEAIKSVAIDAGIKGTTGGLNFAPLSLTAAVAGVGGGGKPVELKAQAGNARADLDKETLNLDGLTVTGLGLNVKGNVDATKIKTDPAFKGNIDIAPFNLRGLMMRLNQDVPITADPNVLTRFGLTGRFAGSSSSIELADFTMALDATTAKGDLSIKNFDKPAVRFGIGIDRIDADRYLAPDTPKGPPAPEAAAAKAAELPLQTLRDLDIQGNLLIGDLRLSGAKLQNVKLAINAEGGRIRLDPVAADLYRGNYAGKIALNATGDLPTLSIDTALKDIDAEALIVDLTGKPSQVAGIASFSGILNGRGATSDALTASLSGQGRFDVRHGVYRGIDARKTLAQAEIAFESGRLGGNVKAAGETPFDSLTGTLDIDRGVIGNRDMLLTSPGLRMKGKGILADLNTNTINYGLRLSVDESTVERGTERYNLGGFSIPIDCRGSISAPNCQPDYQEIVAKALQRVVTDKLGDLLGGKKAAPAQGGQPAPAKPEDLLQDALRGIFD